MRTTRKPSAAIIGRRVGAAVFWLMAVFVIGASTRSVVSALYGKPEPASASASDELRCAQGLRELSRVLHDQAAAELRLPRDRSRMMRWLAAWDRRYAALEQPCPSLSDTRRDLFKLREHIEALLHQHERESLPLTERIERALDRVSPTADGSAHTPKET